MFASRLVPVDPAPELADTDPAGLVWEDSLDHAIDTSHPEGDGDGVVVGWDAGLAVLVGAADREVDAARVGGPVAGWSDRAVVAEIARVERLSRFCAARSYELVAELAGRRPDPSGDPAEGRLSGYAVDELAVSAGIPRHAACVRAAEADGFTTRHPKLLAALSAGLVSVPAARRVLETTVTLDVEQCARVECRLLDRIGRVEQLHLGAATAVEMAGLPTELVMAVSARATTTHVGRVTRDLVRRVDPDAAARRKTRAVTDRSVVFETGADGMAWLTAHTPMIRTLAAYEHLDALARAIPATDGDDRSMDAKRADILLDLLLTGTHTGTNTGEEQAPLTAPVPVNVHVIIDTTTQTSRQVDHSGDLLPGAGTVGDVGRVGRVTAELVRDLLDLADDTAGTVTGGTAHDQTCPGQHAHRDHGPGPYEPSECLKRFIRARYRTCVFPGCRRPSRSCELDHTIPHPTGATCVCNLAPLCIHHHHLKHQAPGWTLTNHADGTLTWTTPTRRAIRVGTRTATHAGAGEIPATLEPATPDNPDPPPF